MYHYELKHVNDSFTHTHLFRKVRFGAALCLARLRTPHTRVLLPVNAPSLPSPPLPLPLCSDSRPTCPISGTLAVSEVAEAAEAAASLWWGLTRGSRAGSRVGAPGSCGGVDMSSAAAPIASSTCRQTNRWTYEEVKR